MRLHSLPLPISCLLGLVLGSQASSLDLGRRRAECMMSGRGGAFLAPVPHRRPSTRMYEDLRTKEKLKTRGINDAPIEVKPTPTGHVIDPLPKGWTKTPTEIALPKSISSQLPTMPSFGQSFIRPWWDGLGEEGRGWVFKGLLLLVGVVYGSNFGAVKFLDNADVDITLILAGRFCLASLALFPFILGQSQESLRAGLEVGLWVSLGYVTQAIGLETTEASKSAFICSLSVVTVPFINALLFKRDIPRKIWVGCALAIVGVGLLTLQGAQGPVIGDLWSLGQPLGFGMGFVRSEQFMRERQGAKNALALTAMQMMSVAAVSLVWAGFTVTTQQMDVSALFEPRLLAALAYTGLITSALAVVVESLVLAYVSVEETTVILSTEPLWASVFGVLFLGERLTGSAYLGGLAIILGCVLTQVNAGKILGHLGIEVGKNSLPDESVNE